MNQVEPKRVMLPADVIWIDFKYNFLTMYLLFYEEKTYIVWYQKPDDSNSVAKTVVIEFHNAKLNS